MSIDRLYRGCVGRGATVATSTDFLFDKRSTVDLIVAVDMVVKRGKLFDLVLCMAMDVFTSKIRDISILKSLL